MPEPNTLPKHAGTIVVGGGVIGCATAYHLAKRGAADVLLLERDILTSGTTWHAAGVVGSLRASVFLTKLTVEACHQLPALEVETGQATGYRRTGGLSIAQTPDRLEELKRVPGISALTGYQGELLTPSEIKQKSPILEVSDLAGGVWIPMDGQTNPTDTTLSFARGARLHGATLIEQTTVQSVRRRNRSVSTVITNRGEIECDQLVLCCGMWTRHLGNALDVAVPLQAIEHMYVVTEPMDDVPADQPFVRDFDSAIYIKGDAGKLLVGSVDPVSKPWRGSGIPRDASFTQLPEDWDHFEPFMEAALKRVPQLERTGIRQFLNGPESFTVDARHVLGPAPGYNNLFIAAGFNTTGIMSSAGAGACIAEWMLDGQPPYDTWEVDPRRFERWSSTDTFVASRTLESPGLAFAMHWPYRQPDTARDVKLSPVHDRLLSAGACCGVVSGWEKPMWYANSGNSDVWSYSYGPQTWWPDAELEAKATAQSVALYDQSQMAVFLIEGPQALEMLQLVCSNNVDVEPGRIVYTQMLNNRGGIEADVTLTRLGNRQFRIVTGAPLRIRDHDWLERAFEGKQVQCQDISEGYAIFSLMGPSSRRLLEKLSDAPLDSESFPFGCSRLIQLGYATVEAQRLSYVGELGYELFVATEMARHVYDLLIHEGRTFGLRHAGLLCMDSCRLEKAYRHWGHELTPSITPLEAGLGFAVDFDKTFTGKRALLQQRQHGITRKLVLFSIAAGEPLLLHDEPIYRNGELVGETTSGARAFRVGGSLAFGLIHNEQGVSRDFILTGDYELSVGLERFSAEPLTRAPYDPTNANLKQ